MLNKEGSGGPRLIYECQIQNLGPERFITYCFFLLLLFEIVYCAFDSKYDSKLMAAGGKHGLNRLNVSYEYIKLSKEQT